VPIMTAHDPFNLKIILTSFILDVWSFFHFPGGHPEASTFMEKMRCLKNGPLVRAMVKHALRLKAEPIGPYFAGAVCHLIADSFPHDGFSGLYSRLNRIKNSSLRIETESGEVKRHIWEKFGRFMRRKVRDGANIVVSSAAEIAAPIGHGPVFSFPDEPYLSLFECETEDGYKISRNNTEYFLEAFQCLYGFLIEFAKDNPLCGQSIEPVPWNSLSVKIREILEQNGSLEERLTRWEKATASGELFPPARLAHYSPTGWSPHKIPYKVAKGIPIETLDSLLFIDAVREYKRLFWEEMIKQGFIAKAS